MRNSTASSGISQWHAMFYETRGHNFGHLHQHPNLANSMEVEGDAPGMWPMKKWMTRLTRWTSCRNRNDCTTFGIVSCFGNSLVHSRSAKQWNHLDAVWLDPAKWMLFGKDKHLKHKKQVNTANFYSRKRKKTYIQNIVTSPHVPQNYYCLKIVMFWLVVLTILKNISQWEGLYHILWKTKNVPNHQPVFLIQIAQSGQLSSATFGHTYSTVDGCEILHQLVGLSRYNPTTDRVS